MKPQWKEARRFEDIRYEKWQGIAKITIDRPEVSLARARKRSAPAAINASAATRGTSERTASRA